VKSVRNSFGSLAIIGGLIASLNLGHAQTTARASQSSTAALDVPSALNQARALAAAEPLLEQSIPVTATGPSADRPSGTYWSLQNVLPPLPFDMFPELPVYVIDPTNRVFLVDDRSVDFTALRAQQAEQAQAGAMMNRMMGLAGGDFESAGAGASLPLYGSNDLWLEITGVSSGQVALNLHGGTNQVYAIWGTSDLLAGWNVETEVWPTNAEVMPFIVPTLERQNLFVRAQDWTGVDSDGDGIPDWWEWEQFGNLSQTGSGDADGDGVSNLQEYLNGTDPNQNINFTVRLGNQHFNTTNASGSYLVLNGVPSYEAVLAGTDDLDSAVWSNYDGIVHLPLGSTNGAYQVWLGLKGHAPNASPIWMGTTVYLDRAAPVLVITNPTNSVVAQPYLQLQGYSDKPLAAVSFDVTNALGVLTNQAGYVTQHTLDTNTLEFTSDYFQCYDILLTNGINTITLRATDPAGNLTTTNFTVTLDYASATNPVIKLYWPQDGTKIIGSSFNWRGWVDDATATVIAQIVDTNGVTNLVQGLVERDGKFWAQNLPLASGTNYLTLSVTNTAGLLSETNIMVVKSEVVLTINPVSGNLWLPTVQVTGAVSDTNCTVWVNGVPATITPYLNGTGYWIADNVPVGDGGTASFTATVYPPGEAPGSSGGGGTNPSSPGSADLDLDADKPPGLVLESAKWGHTEKIKADTDIGGWWEVDKIQGNYSRTSGGKLTTHTEAQDTNEVTYYSSDLTQTIAPDFSIIAEHFEDSDGNMDDTNYGGTISIAKEEGTLSVLNPYSTPITPRYESAPSEVKFMLHTGGKGRVGQQSVAVANAFAGERLARPYFGMDGPSIPSPQITISGLGKNLGSDGYAYGAVASGASVDMTLQAYVPKFSFEVGAGSFWPTVSANYHDLSQETPEFCVGQLVTFSPLWWPSYPPYTVLGDNYTHWHLPGKFVNKETNYSDSATCTTYVRDDALLSLWGANSDTSCWFVNKPGGMASVVINLHFSNGQYVSVAAMGKFDIVRPTIWLEPLSNDWQNHYYTITTNVVGLYALLKLGKNDGSGDGSMRFYIDINSKYGGAIGLTQLITANYSNPTYMFSHERCDGSEFYDGPNAVSARSDSGPSGFVAMNDGPQGYWLDPNIVSLSCRDFIRFQPSGGIYVTLGIATWDTVGVAHNLFGIWSIDSSSTATTGPDGPNNSDEFPVWKINQLGMH
jgi:hypothetical protein